MYLALLPDAESLAALRQFAPTLPTDAHLTVIHSSAVLCPMALPTWTGELTLAAQGVRLFGGRIKKPVLVLDSANIPIRSVRKQAEDILRTAVLPWSTGWGFAPHIAIGLGPHSGPMPTTVRFDRMEWR